jgi:acylphosphatase
MAEMVSRAKVHFGGHVQGVGFRYSVLQVARGFEVAGTVENLYDGRVLLDVEGEESELKAFLGEISRQLEAYIRETEDRWERRERQFRDFIIAPTRR